MASKFKQHLSQRILDSLSRNGNVAKSAHIHLPKQITIGNNKDGKNIELYLPLKNFHSNANFILSGKSKIDFTELKSISRDSIVCNVQETTDKYKGKFIFTINRDSFVEEVLNDMIQKPDPYRKIIDIISHSLGKKVVIEYSSPNIAKPFHMGHLRSTIIGNFISKLHEFLSCKVVKINYLGDWGTQFGLVQVGLDMCNYSDEAMKHNPIQLLYEAYVRANKEAETNPNITVKARQVFQRMEQGIPSNLDKWHMYRQYTVEELQQLYQRLDVTFSEYAWESTYGARAIKTVLEMLKDNGLLRKEEDGKQVVDLENKRHVPIIKSDGSTLYLTRDIAAAIDRYGRHNFDEMLYIVDNAQSDHFVSLFQVLLKMGLPWANQLQHIKFGRIRGMSTRKGTVVFLKDILNEAKHIMQRKQLASPTTKISLTDECERTSDILGLSAIIINDLKQRRQRDYEFDWNRALQVQGDTGIRLQYTHCRLWSLEKRSKALLPQQCDASLLREPEVTLLVQEIARFEEILRKSYDELEACVLVNYLFQLCNHINRAFKTLPIKDQDSAVGSQRLMLFHASRLVLNQGMRILGLQPLQEM